MTLIKQLTPPPSFQLNYGSEIEDEIRALVELIESYPAVRSQFPVRWLAIKLLEQDPVIRDRMEALGAHSLLEDAAARAARLEAGLQEELDTIFADQRYVWINDLVKKTVVREKEEQLTRSDRVDRVLTHQWLGLPIFFAAMWGVFKLTAEVSAPYLDWIDGMITGPVTRWVAAVIEAVGLGSTWVHGLFVDGVIAGVGGVLVFVPVLMSLYLALGLLEDSGYMARAAFVMDRSMRMIGLHGKSFLPMLVGFGCSVPAIYATRTLDNRKDRILTGLLVPFMSCGARLPVYLLFASVFFPGKSGPVVFSLYVIGILTAVGLGLILKKTAFQAEEGAHFIMELPPYRMPTLRTLWRYIWERTRAFIEEAGTIILMTSVVIWLLMAIPVRGGGFGSAELQDSAYGAASEMLAPVFAPLGFGDWEAGGALVSGLVAKEVVVATMSQIYGTEADETISTDVALGEDVMEAALSFGQATLDTLKAVPLIVGINLFGEEEAEDTTALAAAIRADFEETSGGHGALAAFAFMVFVLLYTPCMATISAIRHELGKKWMWVSAIGQFALAWLIALVIFQGGLLLGVG